MTIINLKNLLIKFLTLYILKVYVLNKSTYKRISCNTHNYNKNKSSYKANLYELINNLILKQTNPNCLQSGIYKQVQQEGLKNLMTFNPIISYVTSKLRFTKIVHRIQTQSINVIYNSNWVFGIILPMEYRGEWDWVYTAVYLGVHAMFVINLYIIFRELVMGNPQLFWNAPKVISNWINTELTALCMLIYNTIIVPPILFIWPIACVYVTISFCCYLLLLKIRHPYLPEHIHKKLVCMFTDKVFHLHRIYTLPDSLGRLENWWITSCNRIGRRLKWKIWPTLKDWLKECRLLIINKDRRILQLRNALIIMSLICSVILVLFLMLYEPNYAWFRLPWVARQRPQDVVYEVFRNFIVIFGVCVLLFVIWHKECKTFKYYTVINNHFSIKYIWVFLGILGLGYTFFAIIDIIHYIQMKGHLLSCAWEHSSIGSQGNIEIRTLIDYLDRGIILTEYDIQRMVTLCGNHLEQKYGFLTEPQMGDLYNFKRKLVILLRNASYAQFEEQVYMYEALLKNEQGVSVTFCTKNILYDET